MYFQESLLLIMETIILCVLCIYFRKIDSLLVDTMENNAQSSCTLGWNNGIDFVVGLETTYSIAEEITNFEACGDQHVDHSRFLQHCQRDTCVV